MITSYTDFNKPSRKCNGLPDERVTSTTKSQ